MVGVVAQSRPQGLVTVSRREDSTGLQSLSLQRPMLLSQELVMTFAELFEDFKVILVQFYRVFSGHYQDFLWAFSVLQTSDSINIFTILLQDSRIVKMF